LYQSVLAQIRAATVGRGVRRSAVARLALLVTGILAAESCVLGRVAAELWALGVTAAAEESIGRRLRRALGDAGLAAASCYEPALASAIEWPAVIRRGQTVVLAVDESSQDARVHLLRVGLCYRGTSLPLAWATWEQQAPLAPGAYWAAVDRVLDRVAALLPAGVTVLVTADRAFDIPPFVDRIAARGWHWLVRLKANGAGRFRDRQGREHALRDVVRAHVSRAGQRWKARGQVFKDAGWRAASVVAVWAPGQAEPLVVLSDLPPRWEAITRYGRRFWIEPGFRTDKTKGWQWEDSQVPGAARQERLLLALAWATLLTLGLGVRRAAALGRAQAARAARRVAAGRRPARPQPARHSLFTLGRRLVRRWLYGHAEPPAAPRLPRLDAPSWTDQWRQRQAYLFIFQTVRP
jgi:hypothetical protein